MKKFFKKALITTLCVCTIFGVSLAKANESEALKVNKYITFTAKSGTQLKTKLSNLTIYKDYNPPVYKVYSGDLYGLYTEGNKYKNGRTLQLKATAGTGYYIASTSTKTGYIKQPRGGYAKVKYRVVTPVKHSSIDGKDIFIFDKTCKGRFCSKDKKQFMMVDDSAHFKYTGKKYIIGTNGSVGKFSTKATNAYNFVQKNDIRKVSLSYKIKKLTS